MPIVGLAKAAGVFGPEEIAILTIAHEEALNRLGITDRFSLAAQNVARGIIEIAKAGERDPDRLLEAAIRKASESA